MKSTFSKLSRAGGALAGLLFCLAFMCVAFVLFRASASPNETAVDQQISRAADATCSPIGFSHSTLVDFSATSGEPFINSAPVNIPPNTPAGAPFISTPFGVSNTVSILWKSIDGGRSFIQLGAPIVRDAAQGPGGGDTHQDFDHVGRFYYNDLSVACVTTAVSEDGGNTFAKVNPLACLGPTDPLAAQDDRQWSGAFGGSTLAATDPLSRGYMTVRNAAVGAPGGNFHLARTRDGGVNWNTFNQQIGQVSQSGPLVMDKTKRNIGGTNYILGYQVNFVAPTNGPEQLKLLRIRDDDTGAPTVAVDDINIITPGGSVSEVFPNIAVGRDGGVYAVWSNGSQIRMVSSQDHGQTWSAAKVVSAPAPPAAKIMPWIIAGDAGRVNIVWYQSTGGLGNQTSNRWQIYMAQTLNAYDATPTFTTVPVSENTIHFGEICLRGLNCDLPLEPGDRSFLEYPSITLDHRGAAQITFNDNTNQSGVTAAEPQASGAPYVMFAKQTRGPSLFADVGMVDQGPGTVGIAQPTTGQQVTATPLNISGTHTLPPGTFDIDEANDAIFPDKGPTLGPNVAALDIRNVTVTDNATNLVVTMQVADTNPIAINSAPAATGGDGLLYLAQWDYDQSTADPIDKVFWVAAEVRGGVPVGRTGTLGVIRSATSKKYITYNPVLDDSLQVTVTITPGTPGTITMTIPRALVGAPPNGAELKTFTAYAMSERGPLTPCPDNTPAACENVFTPTSLPLKVDASGAFTYVVGEGPQFDGIVEYSLDDPTFANARRANLNAANQNWTGQLSCSDLSTGAHTLYVRQVINCNVPSAVASVPFAVPNPFTCAVSRKTHTGGGTFDVELPLTGTVGVEPRRSVGDSHQIVVTFANPVTSIGSSNLTGTGNITNVAVNGTTVTADLTGVSNAQTVRLNLVDVNSGGNTSSVSVPMGVLLGDSNADRTVNSGDAQQTRNRSGQTVDATNFRSDANTDGTVNSGDAFLVRARSGTTLGPP